jgi:uncharacterized protein YuzE
MNIKLDKIADALYITVGKGKISKSVEVSERMVVDMSKSGKILGVELLDISSEQGSKEMDALVKNGVPVQVMAATPITA